MAKFEAGKRVVVGPEVANPVDVKWIGQVGTVQSIVRQSEFRTIYEVALDGEDQHLQFFEEDLTG